MNAPHNTLQRWVYMNWISGSIYSVKWVEINANGKFFEFQELEYQLTTILTIPEASTWRDSEGTVFSDPRKQNGKLPEKEKVKFADTSSYIILQFCQQLNYRASNGGIDELEGIRKEKAVP
jgi:hypothetical protein